MLKSRIQKINSAITRIGPVVYVISRDVRISYNHALQAASMHALATNEPLYVVFILYPNVKNRQKEQYEYLLKGLQEVELELNKLNIPLVKMIGSVGTNLNELTSELQPGAIYFDFSPLKGPVSTKNSFAQNANYPCYVVDTHNVVPVWVASNKLEWAAYTIRPKITKLLPSYLVNDFAMQAMPTMPSPIKLNKDWAELYAAIPQRSANYTDQEFVPGYKSAKVQLNKFLSTLAAYPEKRNDPSNKALSGLSPYLHYGQISALEVALAVNEYAQRNGLEAAAQVFLEELIVRKELSDNYCYYNQEYANLQSAPDWAKITLHEHELDAREFKYSYEQLALGLTHDPAWNAAQLQMTTSGKMHGYMRMYWCKKILEWTASPSKAVEFAIKLNDTYSLDGYDPNGYVGIMWSLAGVHDRGWTERPIFGKIRYMNFAGLKRKFNIESYINTWLKSQ